MNHEAYIEMCIYGYRLDKLHLLCTEMIVKSLDVDKNCLRIWINNEDLIGPEVPYLVQSTHDNVPCLLFMLWFVTLLY